MLHKLGLAKTIGVTVLCSHLLAGGAMSANVLLNGNFDANPAGIGWTQIGAIDPPIIGPSEAITEHSAPYLAQLGGFVNSNHELYQTVTIPSGATSLTLTGYYQIRTDETGTTTVYDEMKIQLRTTSNVVLQTLGTWSNLNPTSVWTLITLPATNSHAGETIRLYVSASNDFDLPTSFFLDTLTLEASVPTSVPPPSPLTSWGRIKGVYR